MNSLEDAFNNMGMDENDFIKKFINNQEE